MGSACCWLLLLTLSFGLNGLCRAQDSESLVYEIQLAIDNGEGAIAIDLICDWADTEAHDAFGDPQPVELPEEWTRFQHTRYEEVFEPPTGLDAIFAACNESKSPQFQVAMEDLNWETIPLIGATFGSSTPSDEGEVMGGGHLHVSTLFCPIYSVDLDLDDAYEVIYDGTGATYAPELVVETDEAEDGQRAQWLIARKGHDPRKRPEIWIYKDGRSAFILVDPGANGENIIIRSLCLLSLD